MTQSQEAAIIKLRSLGVQQLSLDSRHINPITAFIALPGSKHHGLDFLTQALEAGTPCVLIDSKDSRIASHEKIIPVENLQETLGYFAAEFYGHPSQHLKIHAITGTNGKTSCSQFIAQIFSVLGQKCGVIGTLGMGVWPTLQEIPNTTPDVVTLQSFFAHCISEGVENISMEVSSIALAQNRLQACEINSAIFTNLTQDHLDYHGTMESYGEEKKKLFAFPGLKHAIMNLDDDFGRNLVGWVKAHSDVSTKTYSKVNDPPQADVFVKHVVYAASGITAEIQTSKESGELHSPLLGEFNLENLLAVLTWMLSQGISFEGALTLLSELKNPRGRMEALRLEGKPMIVIDYAHTPDALEKALKVLRKHTEGKLWCVFGCGGNRDKTKRPLMGEIAMSFADEVVLTSDNPRDEDPEEIIQEIRAARVSKRLKTEADRATAIKYAITHAHQNDIVLIAGKGHETYQEIKGKKIPFDDRVIVSQFNVL